MSSVYRNFEELARREREGEDYRIHVVLRPSEVLVMAPHGGKIELGTTELAKAIAAAHYSFYSLEGLKSDGNDRLHITSHLFDEPRALQAVSTVRVVLGVHGQCDARRAYVMVGGLHRRLRAGIERRLDGAGFEVRPPSNGLSGAHPANICNRGMTARGAQLEISRGLRDLLRGDPVQFETFARAVRVALAQETASK